MKWTVSDGIGLVSYKQALYVRRVELCTEHGDSSERQQEGERIGMNQSHTLDRRSLGRRNRKWSQRYGLRQQTPNCIVCSGACPVSATDMNDITAQTLPVAPSAQASVCRATGRCRQTRLKSKTGPAKGGQPKGFLMSGRQWEDSLERAGVGRHG